MSKGGSHRWLSSSAWEYVAPGLDGVLVWLAAQKSEEWQSRTNKTTTPLVPLSECPRLPGPRLPTTKTTTVSASFVRVSTRTVKRHRAAYGSPDGAHLMKMNTRTKSSRRALQLFCLFAFCAALSLTAVIVTDMIRKEGGNAAADDDLPPRQLSHTKRRDFVTLKDIQLVGTHTSAAGLSLRDIEPPGKAANNTAASSEPIVLHHIIPRIMTFTYATNLLETKTPSHFYENVQHTIAEYRKAWGQPEAPVHFLDDDDCRTLLQRVEPELLVHFNKEKQGMFKADICRVAALFEYGGYYFDVDIQVVKPVRLAESVGFSTVFGHVFHPKRVGFFQAFLAAAPGHPILKEALRIMLLHYEGSYVLRDYNMGACTLKDAYDAVPKAHRGKVSLLYERCGLKADMYPDLPRLQGSGMCDCVVHGELGELEDTVYFYSRLVGTRLCSAPRRRNPNNLHAALAA